MDALIVVVAIVIIGYWAGAGLQKAGVWLCEMGQSLTELSAIYKSAALHRAAPRLTKGGQDEEELFIGRVRDEIRTLVG